VLQFIELIEFIGLLGLIELLELFGLPSLVRGWRFEVGGNSIWGRVQGARDKAKDSKPQA
jgi:hypothetical protein